ncbi:Transcriptional regulatory protein, C terminal [Micromonospora pallida]|uniref:Transcriptional regulatory protein, C terminal n=1 Tax=Micromonospora pallida TaxID=145854 RepID=A0A1C6SDI0_9ACTN|nr:BTAD domain-containing putative transcriptional regulator [Micromonospora pallida]SCL27377.1 Transcriptional regulatory protein, C terminal [Micromonospora pallida]
MDTGNQSTHLVEVRTFGKFEVFIKGRRVTRWRAGKARNLLQYLLLRPGRVVPRDVLFEALWPALDPPRGSLKVAVHTLRSILADSGAAATAGKNGSGISILTQECGYSIETTDVWVDFQEFGALILQAQDEQANGAQEDSLAKLRAAVALYQGDFLPGVTMPWAEPQREWLRSLALSALNRLVVAATEADDTLQVLNYCHKILEIDSLHEETYRTLIQLHGQLGQLGQAHRWYKLCSSRLREVVGIGPNEATRTVYREAVSGGLVTVTQQSRRLGPLAAMSGPSLERR